MTPQETNVHRYNEITIEFLRGTVHSDSLVYGAYGHAPYEKWSVLAGNTKRVLLHMDGDLDTLSKWVKENFPDTELNVLIYYTRHFSWEGDPGAGFGFPCDKDGNVAVEELHECGRRNYEKCLAGGKNVYVWGGLTLPSRMTARSSVAPTVCMTARSNSSKVLGSGCTPTVPKMTK